MTERYYVSSQREGNSVLTFGVQKGLAGMVKIIILIKKIIVLQCDRQNY